MYYLFIKDDYSGTFWKWSWDMEYHSYKTNAGLAWIFFWVPLFFFNGIAFIIFLTGLVEILLTKKTKP